MDIKTQELINKYKKRLEAEIAGENTREYQMFKLEFLPKKQTLYEKLCKSVGKYVQPRIPEKKKAGLEEAIEFAKLAVTPEEVVATSYVVPGLFIIFAMVLSILLFGSLFMAMFMFGIGVALIAVLNYVPYYFANNERMAASNQMVLCIFYVVTYMRHTSNLERAVAFAAEHLTPPLAEDMKKVLWDVQTNKYQSVKQSLDSYLLKWKKYNKEFVESFNLIQSSLFEESEQKRVGVLEKSLDTILEQTYEKMLHFAQNLKSPITLLHMMGIILPILGMVMLPMVVSFMESVRWWHIAMIYNIAFPCFVYFFGKKIMSSRPTGYGSQDITEFDEKAKKAEKITYKFKKKEYGINPLPLCLMIGVFIAVIAIIPAAAKQFIQCQTVEKQVVCSDINLPLGLSFFGYRPSVNSPDLIIGPFGLGASLMSSAIPLALALSFGLYYALRSWKVMKIREDTQRLESEFTTALTQFGNRLGDGIPAEIAFDKVAETMSGTQSGTFFSIVSTNIRQLGMGVQQALFDSKRGAILSYPSSVINSSMKILSESIKKGPLVASNAILNIARYIKEMHKVNERLKDLLSEIIGDMKSQISFLTPAIASIVIAITAMISHILGSLSTQLKTSTISLGEGATGTANLGGGALGILSMFGDGIPTYYFQLVIGTYVFQIIYLLTTISNNIENGNDQLQERYLLGKNLIKSTIMYVLMSSVLIIVFSIISATIVNKINIGTG
ncbi:hypothetical protein HY486_02150 [Candidatus Woesearchaeota archaeon]|nr:hypothetical protein [Candidatus Woesearchaeota archaeon]